MHILKSFFISLGKLTKYFLFILILLEVVVMYFALTEEYANLAIGYINNKLSNIGYYFSAEQPIRFLFRYILPAAALWRFVQIKYSGREELIKVFKKVYKKFTSLQLLICFVLISIFGYYLNKFYALLYKKYKDYSV